MIGELSLIVLCGLTCVAYCVDITRYKVSVWRSRRKREEEEGS
jgi:hypothetical protein